MTEREARDAFFARQEPATYQPGHFVVKHDRLRFVPTGVMRGGEPKGFRHRVERARAAKARTAFALRTVRTPAAPLWAPTQGTGDHGRASRTERRRTARRSSSRSSDDDPSGEPPSPQAGGA